MSYWRNCGVEDAFWQECGETNHCIVPQEEGNGGAESNDILWTKEELAFCSSPIGSDGSLSHAYSEVLPPALGSLSAVKGIIPLASQDGQRATKSFIEYNINAKKCDYGAKNIHVTSEGAVNSEHCRFSLDGISAAENGFNYMENNKAREDDLFYYGLPDISNIEDLDEILSCDSTYGERSNNTQSWLSSSSKDVYVSERTSNSGLQFSPSELRTINSTSSCLSANSLSRNGPSIINEQSYRDYQFLKLDTATLQMYDASRRTGLESSVTQGCNDYGFKNADNFNKIDVHIEQLYEGQKSSSVEGNNQLQSCTSSRSFSIPSHMHQYTEQKYFPSSFTSPDAYYSQLSGKQDSFLDSEFPSCFPISKPPSQVQSSSLFHEDLFMHTVLSKANNAPDVRQKGLYRKQGAGSSRQTASAEKQQNSKQDTAKDMKMIVEGKAGSIDSFAVHRSSPMPSVHSDDISSQKTSFKQLHNVMCQLDARTKLCIRDSLYRLARSAEKRHSITCTNGVSDHINGAYGTRKKISRAQPNVEAETNPIDRSVAHMLFHRPSKIAAKPVDNPMLLESDMIVDGPIIPNR